MKDATNELIKENTKENKIIKRKKIKRKEEKDHRFNEKKPLVVKRKSHDQYFKLTNKTATRQSPLIYSPSRESVLHKFLQHKKKSSHMFPFTIKSKKLHFVRLLIFLGGLG